MPSKVQIELVIGVEVIDPDALRDAAIAKYAASHGSNTPPDFVEMFEDKIRTDPAAGSGCSRHSRRSLRGPDIHSARGRS